jgi:putative copper resistance protein D
MTLPDIWGLMAIATKFALYLGILISSGSIFASLAFRLNAYRGHSASLAVLGLFAALFSFLLLGANLTGDLSGLLDRELLLLLWSTPAGTTLAYQITGMGLLVCGLFLGWPGCWISAFGGLIAIWSFSSIGHIAGHDSLLLEITLAAHLAAIAFWLGILKPLTKLSSSQQTWPAAADLGHRFGLVAVIFVPLALAAGLYMSFILVGSLNALVNTGYGQTLILKSTFVSLLLALAAANKFKFVPALRQCNPQAAEKLIRSINAEWVIIFGILGITAILTSSLNLPM